MKALKSLILVITLVTIVYTGCSDSSTGSPSPTQINSPRSYYCEHLSTFGIIIVDFQTLEIENAYMKCESPCSDRRPPVSDEELVATANDFFSSVDNSIDRQPVFPDNSQDVMLYRPGLDILHVGQLVLLEVDPGDFGSIAICDSCSGLVLFGGSIVWNGRGRQLYPSENVDSEALQDASRTCRMMQQPASILANRCQPFNIRE